MRPMAIERERASQETCWTMVRDAAGGDEAARQAFATQYQRLVRGFIAGFQYSSFLM